MLFVVLVYYAGCLLYWFIAGLLVVAYCVVFSCYFACVWRLLFAGYLSVL